MHEAVVSRQFRIQCAPVIAVHDRRQFAIRGHAGEVPADIPQEFRIVGAGRPCKRLSAGEIECDAQIRVPVMSQRELGGIGNGVIDDALCDAI